MSPFPAAPVMLTDPGLPVSLAHSRACMSDTVLQEVAYEMGAELPQGITVRTHGRWCVHFPLLVYVR